MKIDKVHQEYQEALLRKNKLEEENTDEVMHEMGVDVDIDGAFNAGHEIGYEKGRVEVYSKILANYYGDNDFSIKVLRTVANNVKLNLDKMSHEIDHQESMGNPPVFSAHFTIAHGYLTDSFLAFREIVHLDQATYSKHQIIDFLVSLHELVDELNECINENHKMSDMNIGDLYTNAVATHAIMIEEVLGGKKNGNL